MMKPRGLSIGLLFVLACSLSAAAQVLPPIPNGVIGEAQKAGRPMLAISRDQARESERLTRYGPVKARGEEFLTRVEGFMHEDSPFYIGEGPFQKDVEFHPGMLGDADFLLYSRIVIEMYSYVCLKHERWGLSAVRVEFNRLLDEIDRAPSIGVNGLPETDFTPRRALMLGLAAMLFDEAYFRIDTIDRHEPSRRFDAARQRLAAHVRTLSPADTPPGDCLAYGAGLGLSSLFCISIFDNEWGKDRNQSASSLLPDLYNAAALTSAGLDRAEGADRQFALNLTDLETRLLLAAPFTQTLSRLGYAQAAPPNAWSRLAAALEVHRIPGKTDIIAPNPSEPVTTAWVPATHSLVVSVSEDLYDAQTGQTAASLPLSPGDTEPGELPIIQQPANSLSVDIEHPGKRMTLREQLERFGLPRPPAAEPTPQPSVEQRRAAGWTRRSDPPVPPMWGVVYRLADVENPQLGFAGLWDQIAGESDNHPYAFLYYRPAANGYANALDQAALVRYPDSNITALSVHEPREEFFLATQSATDTVLASTITLTHESFLMVEGGMQWRWFHEIAREGVAPSALHAATETVEPATETVEAASGVASSSGAVSAGAIAAASDIEPVSGEAAPAGLLESATGVIANATVENVSPEAGGGAQPVIAPPWAPAITKSLQTSIYTVWEDYAPQGKTVIVRRHGATIGSPFSVIAHYPAQASPVVGATYVIASIPSGAQTQRGEFPEWVYMDKPGDELSDEIYNVRDFQVMRRMERMGKYAPNPSGKLHFIFSPESMAGVRATSGVLGDLMEMRLTEPVLPFFYLVFLEQKGREPIAPKYASLPFPGLRVLEWRDGVEVIAVAEEDKIDNPFIESDADLVVATRDSAMKGVFYLMVNGSYLKVKFSPNQITPYLLADNKGEKITAAWSDRRVYVTRPPKTGGVFYAPELVGFECGESVIRYGRKSRQAVVLGAQ
ncbi:MAG: hypothetical protein GC154_03970 [bacterium]|nr:hypothetical protein [bacterium]